MSDDKKPKPAAPPPAGPPGAGDATVDLDLSDDELAKLREEADAFRKQVDKVIKP